MKHYLKVLNHEKWIELLYDLISDIKKGKILNNKAIK